MMRRTKRKGWQIEISLWKWYFMSIKSWIFLENDDAWTVKVGTRIEFEVGRVSFEDDTNLRQCVSLWLC